MFKFLKDKLKGAISRFTQKAEEEATPAEIKPSEPVEETPAEEEINLSEPSALEAEEKSEEETVEEVREELAELERQAKEKPEPVFEEEKVEMPVFEEEPLPADEEPEPKEEPAQEPDEKATEEDVPLTKWEPAAAEEATEGKTGMVTEEPVEKALEETKEALAKAEKPGFFKRLFGKLEGKFAEKKEEEVKGEKPLPVKKKEAPAAELKQADAPKSVFQKIAAPLTTTTISSTKFDELFWELEVALLESNVAVEVIEKIKLDLKEKVVDRPLRRGKVDEAILDSLKSSLHEILDIDSFDLLDKIAKKKPYVLCFVGVNGSGKTTTIAKLAKKLLDHGLSCVIAASDTFRAAAIDQLQQHALALGVKLIKHDYGADPAAVAFDALQHAKAKNIDAVLIDTAGRLHSNDNLLDEMKKIVRVAKPDAVIFVGESITGNDCVEQAKKFSEAVQIDGIILAKADIDEKGGAAVSISYVTKKPILYLGTGQRYEDLEAFNPEKIMASLGL